MAGVQSCRFRDLSRGSGDCARRRAVAARIVASDPGAGDPEAGDPGGRCLAMIKHDRAVTGDAMMQRARAIALAGACLSLLVLPGCTDVRTMLGMDRSGPDEFAVESRAPLLIPP